MAAFTSQSWGSTVPSVPTRHERIAHMDEPWGSSRHLYETPDYGWYPVTFTTDVSDATDNSAAFTFTDSGNTGSNIYIPPDDAWEEDAQESIKERHRALSRQAVLAGQAALRGARDDPGVRVPLPARKAPYVRPRAKKRVCAGSSRYRVLVN